MNAAAHPLTLTKIAASALLLALASSAHATTALTATEILQQFNLVVLGNDVSYSHVDGRTFVGGSLSGGDYVQHTSTTPASSYAGLTVLGSVSGVNVNAAGLAVGGSVSNSNVNVGGAVVLGNSSNTNYNGSVPSYVAGTRNGGNANSGSVSSVSSNSTLQSFSDAMYSTNFASVLSTASDSLTTLTANSSITISGNKAIFNAVVNSQGVAVFTIDNDAWFFANITEYEFNLNGATTVIINSDLSSGTLNANFLGGSAQTIGAETIWNFSSATSLTISSQWGGTVLATDAAVINYNNIEGTLVAASLTQYGEIHAQQFTGILTAVPEPSTYGLMAIGLITVGAFARRRKAGSQNSAAALAA